jgi:hypothetical protein
MLINRSLSLLEFQKGELRRFVYFIDRLNEFCTSDIGRTWCTLACPQFFAGGGRFLTDGYQFSGCMGSAEDRRNRSTGLDAGTGIRKWCVPCLPFSLSILWFLDKFLNTCTSVEPELFESWVVVRFQVYRFGARPPSKGPDRDTVIVGSIDEVISRPGKIWSEFVANPTDLFLPNGLGILIPRTIP